MIFQHRSWLLKYLGVEEINSYETKRGYHIRITLKRELSDIDVQMLQMLMGSDIHREIYNFIRRIDGKLIEEWNKLYTKKHLVLKTRIKETLSEEKYCRVLQKKVLDAIKNAKDLEGYI